MHRKQFEMVMVMLALSALSACGQLTVQLDITHPSYLVNETLNAQAIIHNDGADPVVLNSPDGRGPQVKFAVELDSGPQAWERSGATPLPRVVVPSGQTQVVTADLASLFNIAVPGRYFVRVQLTGGAEEVRSHLKMLDVVPGLELAHTRSVIDRDAEIYRTYSLRYWARDRSEYLFLCVFDAPSNRSFSPINLGRLVRVMRPSVSVAGDGIVTVKHQLDRSQMMISTLESRPERLTLISQKPERMRPPTIVKPATLPSK